MTIAVIDSGVHADHPHVGGVVGGIGIDEDGFLHNDYVDRLGHGTAVTAAIREKAPDSDILIIKVFGRTLGTSTGVLDCRPVTLEAQSIPSRFARPPQAPEIVSM